MEQYFETFDDLDHLLEQLVLQKKMSMSLSGGRASEFTHQALDDLMQVFDACFHKAELFKHDRVRGLLPVG